MSKGKWGKALALGGLLALGIWLLWQMGLALLTVKSVLPEDALILGQWAGAFLAAMGLGGLAAGLLPRGGKRRKKAPARKGRR